MGAWMLFVATTQVPDLALGAASAVLTTLLVTLIRRQSGHRVAFCAAWLPSLLFLLPRLFADTATVFAALFQQIFRGRPVRGAFRAVPYAGVYATEPEASAADAFVLAANSLTPNTIVLDIDRVEGLVLLHQLSPQSREAVRRQFVRAR